MLSCDQELGQDVQKIFQQVAALGKPGKLKALLQSPFTLHGILKLIETQRQKALQGQPALIRLANGLLSEVIEALYKASQAGVQIDLIVRGMLKTWR